MPRTKTPSFVAEFALRTTAADEAALNTRLEAARNIYNAALGEGLRRLAWQAACAMPKGAPRSAARKARAAAFKGVRIGCGFSPGSLQKFCEGCRDPCWIGDHLGSHDTQTTSLRAFRAVEQYAFGRRGRPRFKGKGRLHSIGGKGDAVIRFRADPVPAVHYAGLVLPLMLDWEDKRGWQNAALAVPTKLRPPWCAGSSTAAPAGTASSSSTARHRCCASRWAASSGSILAPQRSLRCRAKTRSSNSSAPRSRNPGRKSGAYSALWSARAGQPMPRITTPMARFGRARNAGGARSATGAGSAVRPRSSVTSPSAASGRMAGSPTAFSARATRSRRKSSATNHCRRIAVAASRSARREG
jgi:hypothetical protein